MGNCVFGGGDIGGLGVFGGGGILMVGAFGTALLGA